MWKMNLSKKSVLLNRSCPVQIFLRCFWCPQTWANIKQMRKLNTLLIHRWQLDNQIAKTKQDWSHHKDFLIVCTQAQHKPNMHFHGAVVLQRGVCVLWGWTLYGSQRAQLWTMSPDWHHHYNRLQCDGVWLRDCTWADTCMHTLSTLNWEHITSWLLHLTWPVIPLKHQWLLYYVTARSHPQTGW